MKKPGRKGFVGPFSRFAARSGMSLGRINKSYGRYGKGMTKTEFARVLREWHARAKAGEKINLAYLAEQKLESK